MLTAFIICSVYIFLLFVITKLFGIKYTEIIKNNHTIRNGIVFPVVIGTVILTSFAFYFDWIPGVFSYSPVINNPILWIIPIFTVISIVARFLKINRKYFQKNGLLLLAVGLFFVGFSEELLVRGIAVNALLEDGFSVMWAGIFSSLIFGLLHFMNYFNGQDIKKTTIQVLGTFLMGLNFYFIYILTGSLWYPIIAHFLYDFSILAMGDKPTLSSKDITTKVISISTVGMFILPVFGLLFIVNK